MTDLRKRLDARAKEVEAVYAERLREYAENKQRERERLEQMKADELHESQVAANNARAEFYGCLSTIVALFGVSIGLMVLYGWISNLFSGIGDLF